MPTIFPSEMMHDSVWMDRLKFVEAEDQCQMFVSANAGSITTATNNTAAAPAVPAASAPVEAPVVQEAPVEAAPVKSTAPSVAVCSPLITEITAMRANIKSQLESMGSGAPVTGTQVAQLEKDTKSLRSLIEDVSKQLAELNLRVGKLEAGAPVASAAPPAPVQKTAPAPAAADDDDDDFDLFGDDDEDEEEEETEEAKKKREALLAKYHEKKSKKPAVIAKSSIVLDVKPWDDETDMEAMERQVRTIEMDGLLWGASKLVPVGYGIRKLQISCVVEDDKVGSEILSEKITEFEDYVQSVDVSSFNKV